MNKMIKLLSIIISQLVGISLLGFYSVEYNYSFSFDEPADYVRLLVPEGFRADSVGIEIEQPASMNVMAEIVGNYSFAGNRIVNLKIYSSGFNPEREKKISAKDLKITLSCSPAFISGGNKMSRDAYSDRIINRVLRSIIDNKEDVSSSYNVESTLRQVDYAPYIVITVDSLKDCFQPFVHWITRKGIRATIVLVEDILAHYSGDPVSEIYDPAGAVRGFLIDKYPQGIQWVLLGGDEDIVPVRYGFTTGDHEVDKAPPSDLYYSDLNGNWNVDGDEFYGEFADDSVDPYSELFVGRIPCNSRIEADSWVSKALSYEINPGNGDLSYLKRVLWTGADELRTAPDYIIRYGAFPSDFIHDTTMLEDEDGIHPRGSEVITRMKRGYGWFNLYGHGGLDDVVVSCPGPNHPSLDRDFLTSLDTCDAYFHENHWGNNVEPGNGIDSLMVGDKYGIMYISSCYQAAYDQEHFDVFSNAYGPSMAEAFTILPERGGVAFLGFTRAIEFSTALHFSLLDAIFNDSLTNIGVAEAVAKARNYSHKTWISHTLFGDPLMPIWTDIPDSFDILSEKTIPPEPRSFGVAVSSGGVAVEDAYVCLWKDNEVYEAGFTNSLGAIFMEVRPRTEGIMLLTVTKDNFIPYLDTVYIDSNTASVPINEKPDKPSCTIDRNISTDKVSFTFYLPTEERIKLGIFDISGRMIAELTNKKYKEGSHSICWDAGSVEGRYAANGIYFYRFYYKNQILSDKFLLLR